MGKPRRAKLSKAEESALDKEGRRLLKAVLDHVEKSSAIKKMLQAKSKRTGRGRRKK